jgi:hypothetical protein
MRRCPTAKEVEKRYGSCQGRIVTPVWEAECLSFQTWNVRCIDRSRAEVRNRTAGSAARTENRFQKLTRSFSLRRLLDTIATSLYSLGS